MANPNSVLPGVPLVESPLFPSLVDSLGLDEETKRIALDLHLKGYAIIQFPEADFDAVADKIVKTLAPRFDLVAWRQHGWKNDTGLRVQDVWDSCPGVRRIATNQRVRDLLWRIYGRRAFPFQTLNFPVGTQQHYHTDAVHFSSVPERFMCGVQSRGRRCGHPLPEFRTPREPQAPAAAALVTRAISHGRRTPPRASES